jgi:hypothetical protein
MRRTPVRKEKWGVSSGRDTYISRVGQVVPTDRCKAGEQIFAGEAVAAWQCASVLRFCWDLAQGELKGCTVVTVV